VVERDLANSLLFNTFNNLNRLAGTAKYLKRHERHQHQRVLVRVLLDILESHSISRIVPGTHWEETKMESPRPNEM
jgi:hypothetical protein